MTDLEKHERKKPGPKPQRPPQRADIGGSRIKYSERNKLTVKDRDPNFVYRVVNTDNDKYADRIATMQSRGYNMCNNGEELGDEHGTDASSVGSTVGRSVGKGVKGVLMRIPREFFEEDKAAKQAEVDRSEEGMVDEDLRNASDTYGEGLKISDASGTRLEVRRRS